MSETCRLRRGEGYGACDDEVVNQCALRERKKREAPRKLRNAPRPRPHVCERSYRYRFNSSSAMQFVCGMTFSKIAPF